MTSSPSLPTGDGRSSTCVATAYLLQLGLRLDPRVHARFGPGLGIVIVDAHQRSPQHLDLARGQQLAELVLDLLRDARQLGRAASSGGSRVDAHNPPVLLVPPALDQ